jgi:hypothetical protein
MDDRYERAMGVRLVFHSFWNLQGRYHLDVEVSIASAEQSQPV